MALDHVRDLIYINSITQSPTNLTTTSPVIFFTRWITDLCAPIFVFLAGSSAFISLRKSNDQNKTRKLLIKQGLWLILLEYTLVNFGLYFDIHFHDLKFEVIATIGFGFIVLGLLLNVQQKHIAIIVIAIIFLHNALSLISLSNDSIGYTIMALLFNLAIIPINANTTFVMAYQPIPWPGILLLGFASGKLFELLIKSRSRLFSKWDAVHSCCS